MTSTAQSYTSASHPVTTALLSIALAYRCRSGTPSAAEDHAKTYNQLFLAPRRDPEELLWVTCSCPWNISLHHRPSFITFRTSDPQCASGSFLGPNSGSQGQSWSGGEMKRASIPPPLTHLAKRDGEMTTRPKEFPRLLDCILHQLNHHPLNLALQV